MYDAVILFAEALSELDRSQDVQVNILTDGVFIFLNKNLADGGFELWRRGDVGARQLSHQLHEDGRDERAERED